MSRTWLVRLLAMEFTESVRSLQVPDTPRTLAWPPSLPSVPTSRATRVTSAVNSDSWSTIALTVRPIRRNSPRSGRLPLRSSMRWDRSPSATASITRADLGDRPDQVVDQRVGVLVAVGPGARGVRAVEPLGQPAVASRRTPDPAQLGGQPRVALGDLVVGAGQLEQDAVAGLGQPAAELAVPHVLQRRQQPAYRDLVDGRLPPSACTIDTAATPTSV